jgi:hypothetical protein
LAFYVEDTVDIRSVPHWVRKSWDSGGNSDPNDQPHPGRPISTAQNLI